MANNPTVWGVHMGAHVGDRPIEGNYVAIGWGEMGDIQRFKSRDEIKAEMTNPAHGYRTKAIPVQAGVLFRFANEIKAGDVVVFPSKHDRTIHIGRFTGAASYVAGDTDEYPNHRAVEWLAHIPRDEFSQNALYEIGSAITLFLVRRYAAEFLAKIGVAAAEVEALPDPDAAEDAADNDTVTQTISRQAEETTGDFVIRRIMSGLSGHDFEDFIAHLLECMGYTARATAKSGDGGVDVIAHMDALGLQPPIIKVQCKRMTSPIGIAEVNQLLGTLGEGEFGLFVCLGSYTRPAIELERNRSKLRLIDGEQFVEMVLENYGKLSPRYRTLVPLKQIYVPDLPKS
jgi:restriction system protein